jgi:hypothetical protein
MEAMRRTNLYLDPEKLRALKMIAASEDASVSDLVREAIDGMIAKRLSKIDAPPENGSMAQLSTTLLDDALRGIDAKRPADIPQDEIERDVADAVREARTERTARRRRSASTPAVGNG